MKLTVKPTYGIYPSKFAKRVISWVYYPNPDSHLSSLVAGLVEDKEAIIVEDKELSIELPPKLNSPLSSISCRSCSCLILLSKCKVSFDMTIPPSCDTI